ncbi:hypothetical protein QR680_013377 [Steinernema hermaphroditum]|uniref:Small ribosomal subunit protein uS10m n=1 Tax=Steinernema hermaphroditum TaxID=289476 RepID=A0AA39I5B7_9BILA|nr:hypothetical protein QR680_013377 [Steinernema hermaphroditum]
MRAISALKNLKPQRDELFRRVSLEIRGHDPAVLNSYTTFLTNACSHLEIKADPVEKLPYVRWVQPLLRSKFVHKNVHDVTGSTASTMLEYVQRNIPEGVAMKVTYDEICALPESFGIQNS